MLRLTPLHAALSLALLIVQGCARSPDTSSSTELQPSYVKDNCSAQLQREQESCIPANAPLTKALEY